MRAPRSVRSAEDFGRIRLSRNFFMREFLYSEIANVHGFTNLPSHPELAISAGRALCEHILEPLRPSDTGGQWLRQRSVRELRDAWTRSGPAHLG